MCTSSESEKPARYPYLRAGRGADPQSATAFGGLACGFEGAGATGHDAGGRAGPWLWQGWPRGTAAGEGGRRVNRLEGT